MDSASVCREDISDEQQFMRMKPYLQRKCKKVSKRQIEIQKNTRVEFCLHPCVLFQVCTFLRLSG